MSKINNLEYAALNLSGDNYFQWVLDTKIILKSKNLGACITDGNESSENDRYSAILIIRHHLAESLKDQYLTIVSKLKLCGETITDADMLEKTFSTFHTSNVLLQQQYREKGFSTYANLISCLLLAEQNNELLMRNSEMRPPGAKALPEAHAAIEPKDESPKKESNHGRMRGRGRWQGRNRGFQPRDRGFQPRDRWFQPRDRGFQPHEHLGSSRGRGYGRGNGRGYQPSRGYKSDFKTHGSTKSSCHRCGMTNHWANRCKTPSHLVKLYQESIKGKNPVAHWVHHDDENDLDHEDVQAHDNDDQTEFETSDILKEAN
ncbi:uncharacterized protein LOC106448073 [Brassica napus]|uniref:uncharacterized protein LOC106448073 n=1 Tax=Brassica napus TaxID=3708 RepID=UPI00207943E2|nr:uncharacterized protein LOC106448073 [Brassica napus]